MQWSAAVAPESDDVWETRTLARHFVAVPSSSVPTVFITFTTFNNGTKVNLMELNELFTLHGNGNGASKENWTITTGNNWLWLLFVSQISVNIYVQKLGPIAPSPIFVPVSVPFPCCVNKP